MSPNTMTQQAEATETGRRQQEATGSREEAFRPVALPALAAACRPRPKAVTLEARPASTRRGILEMVHEDAPVL